MRIANSLIDLVGNTPLVRLGRIFRDSPATVVAKLESFNPAGSVKDRTGLAMVLAAEREGKLRPGMTIVAVEPRTSAVLSGGKPGPHSIQGIGAGFVPANVNRSIIDEIVTMPDDDALSMMHRLAKEEGILAGISAGAAVASAKTLAWRTDLANKLIVVLLPDTAERYLMTFDL
jgi:cysteine synthase A